MFLRLDWSYFFIYLKSLYESYLPLSTLFLTLFFNHLIQKQLSAATTAVIDPVISENKQLRKLVLRFDYFHFFDYHKVIVWVLFTTIYIIYHLIFQTSAENRLSADTATVHVKGIFGVYLEYIWIIDSLQKWGTGFDHRVIVCFLKQSEGDLVQTEKVCFILSWVSQLP